MGYFYSIHFCDPSTGKKKELRIVDEICANWETIGEILGFKAAEIKAVRNAGSGKTPQQCLCEVITRWMKNASQMSCSQRYPNNWRGVYNLLQASQHSTIANDLKAAIETTHSDLHGNFDKALLDPGNVTSWSVDDVCFWLNSFELGKCVDTFRDNEVDGECLLTLDEKQLKDDLGITSLGRRKKILEHVKSLKGPLYTDIPLYTDSLLSKHMPKNMMRDVDYTSFCNKIEFLLLTETDLEFNAAATYLHSPNIENHSIMQDVSTKYQPNIALGMFAGGPVALIKNNGGKNTDELFATIKVKFPESKYVISTGTGYGFQQELKLGDVFVSSGLTAIEKDSVSIEGSTAYIHIQGSPVETCDLLQTIFCLDSKIEESFKITNHRTADYQISNIVSGYNVLQDKRLHKITNIVFDPKAMVGDITGKQLLNLQKEGKINGFIIIKAVTEHMGMQDTATLKMKDAWIFTGSLAAVHYIEQKMIPYMYHANSVEHYMSALKTGDVSNVTVAKLVFLGPPMQGKTITRLRLTKAIQNISLEKEKSSSTLNKSNTGVSVQNTVLICKDMLRATVLTEDDGDWIVLDDDEEAKFCVTQTDCKVTSSHMQRPVSQDADILHDDQKELECVTPVEHIQSTKSLPSEEVEVKIVHNEPSVIKKEEFNQSKSSEIAAFHIEWAKSSISDSLKKSKSYSMKSFRNELDNKSLVYMQDTGGQPELMECLPVLTIGPALYLLFCKLNSKLSDTYEIGYRGSDGNIVPHTSRFTIKDTLLSALASVASMSYSLKGQDKDLDEVPQGYVYLVGTHRDRVESDEVLDDFELKLQDVLKSTFFYKKSLIQWWNQEDLPCLNFDKVDVRLVYPLDNEGGKEEEIKCLRTSINKKLSDFFGNQKIPTSWLLFGNRLCRRKNSIISLESCIELGSEFNMSEGVTLSALQFLHYNLGICMHFNNVPALKNYVIPDTQSVYKSLTTLIEAAFKPSKIGPADINQFKEKGKFSVEKFKQALNFSLPLDILVKILEHLNIITPVIDKECEESLFFMPCILPHASEDEITMFEEKDSFFQVQSPLYIRYECGFIPLGIFSSMVTSLIQRANTKKDYPYIFLKPELLRRNYVQFWYNVDVITFIHKPEYIEIQFSQRKKNEQTLHVSCNQIRELVKETLKSITARMLNSLYTLAAKQKYSTHFQDYKFGFKCQEHTDHDHLCVVYNEESPNLVTCVGDRNNTPSEVEPENLLWYGQKLSTPKTYSSEAEDLTVKDVLNAIREVTEWNNLGIQLNIKSYVLKKIKADTQNDTDKAKAEMIDYWLNNLNASWGMLAAALKEIGHGNLSCRLISQNNQAHGTSKVSSVAPVSKESLAQKQSSQLQEPVQPQEQIQQPKKKRKKMNKDLLACWLEENGVEENDVEILKSKGVSEMLFLKLKPGDDWTSGLSKATLAILTDLQDELRDS